MGINAYFYPLEKLTFEEMINLFGFTRHPFCRITALGFLLLFVACKSKDKEIPKKDYLAHIYFDYRLTADEDFDKLTLKLKFLEDDAMGDAITPGGLKSVKLDEAVLPPDSSKMNGVYYETQKLIDSFTGQHTITVTTINGQEFKEEFNFSPFTLVTRLPETIKKEDLPLDFSGLEKEDMIRIVLTDTSFTNNGVNRKDSVLDNHYILAKADLEKLATGPIIMEISREYKKPIKKDDEIEGLFRIDCTLRRSFNLID